VLSPVPAIAPGLMIQFPVGKSFKVTLPVAVEQFVWLIEPIDGEDGVTGCGCMTRLADATEVHPAVFVTVKLYVPETNPEIVLLEPVPIMAPGLIVQFPEGKPLSITLPVATVQPGWVIIPIIGAAGVAGCVFITTFAEGAELHPTELVTVYE